MEGHFGDVGLTGSRRLLFRGRIALGRRRVLPLSILLLAHVVPRLGRQRALRMPLSQLGKHRRRLLRTVGIPQRPGPLIANLVQTVVLGVVLQNGGKRFAGGSKLL